MGEYIKFELRAGENLFRIQTPVLTNQKPRWNEASWETDRSFGQWRSGCPMR